MSNFKMRLSKEQIFLIKNTVKAKDPKAKVFLYGSRINDHLKGGDIDLFIVSEVLKFSDKIDILIDWEEKLGEQHIDLSIYNLESVQKSTFFNSIRSVEI